MKKLSIILILAMVFCAVLAIVPASAEVETTADLKVDTNVFKGDLVAGDDNDVDSVVVWVDVKESKFNDSYEYGTFIYQSCADDKIVLENGSFNPADSGKSTFATKFDTSRFITGIEYAVKGYVKVGDTIKLSKTTAFFNVNAVAPKEFDIVIHGPNITYESQESATNFGGRQDNTQYFVYRDDVLLGATNELKFNVVDELFAEDGTFEAKSHSVTVKSVSGLNAGGQSTEYSFLMQPISTASEFRKIGSEESQDAQNRYQVLTNDIDLTGDGITFRSWTLEVQSNSFESSDEVQSLIRYYADTLDGRGHKVSLEFNGNPNVTDKWFGGIFGMFCKTGYLRNLEYEITATHNVQQDNQKGAGGARACGLTLFGWGSYENCYLKATLKSLLHTPDLGSCWRRDTFIGFPGNYTANNVIAELHVQNSAGQPLLEMRNHQGTGNIGTGFSWESQHEPEAHNFVLISPAKLYEQKPAIGMVKGSYVTFCNSFDNLLSGTNCIAVEGSDPLDENLGVARTDKIYDRVDNDGNLVWDEDIWEFNATEGYIKFFGKKIYQASV